MTATPEQPARCYQTLAAVTSSHRCPACTLDGALRREMAATALLRSDLARLRDSEAAALRRAGDAEDALGVQTRRADSLAYRLEQLAEAAEEYTRCSDCGEARHGGACAEDGDVYQVNGVAGLVARY